MLNITYYIITLIGFKTICKTFLHHSGYQLLCWLTSVIDSDYNCEQIGGLGSVAWCWWSRGSFSVYICKHEPPTMPTPMSALVLRPSAPLSPTIRATYEWLYCPVSVHEQRSNKGLNQVPGHQPAAASTAAENR